MKDYLNLAKDWDLATYMRLYCGGSEKKEMQIQRDA